MTPLQRRHARQKTKLLGDCAELSVAIDLLRKGIEIFRSVSSHAQCDLIALHRGVCIRIEVKTRRKGVKYFPKPLLKTATLKFDVLAVYIPPRSIRYFSATGKPVQWIQKEASRP